MARAVARRRAGTRSTLDYVRAVAIRVIEETGLLPHLNPGVMCYEELARLKHVSASMGMMLETSSDRLAASAAGPHFGSPDKVPAVRLRTIEDAGRLAIPFTTGILVGIGETPRERAESLFAIRDLHRRYRHMQEVIVQNFRAKPGTAMRRAPEPDDEEFLAAVAAARLVLGPHMSVQAPPEPLRRGAAAAAARRRHQRLGRRVAAHARPREPRAAVAGDRGARRDDRRARQRAARAPHDLPAVRRCARIPWLAGEDAGARRRAARRRRPRGRGQRPGAGRLAGPRRPLEAPDDRPHVREGRRRPACARTPTRSTATSTRSTSPAAWVGARRPRPSASDAEIRDALAKAAAATARSPTSRPWRCSGPRAPALDALCRRRRRPPGRGRRRRGHLRHQPEHQLHERLLRRVPVLRVRAAGGRRRSPTR